MKKSDYNDCTKMVKTRSNVTFPIKPVVFPLLTLKDRVKEVKRKHVLSEYEKKWLRSALKPMNFFFADRIHATEYADALESKIKCINLFTNNGVDIFQTKFNFPLTFVYPLLVDFYHLISDYTSIKDKHLYTKHREENDYYLMQPEPKLRCDHCTFYEMVNDIEKKRKSKCLTKNLKKNYGTHLYEQNNERRR